MRFNINDIFDFQDFPKLQSTPIWVNIISEILVLINNFDFVPKILRLKITITKS